MTIIYRVLGAFARLSERMSHTRVNAVPFNLLVLAVLPGVLFFVAVDQTVDAFVNGRTPRTMKLSDLITSHNAERSYVSVRGILLPKDGFQYVEQTKSGSRNVQKLYAPLIDVESRRILLVEVQESLHSKDVERMAVTGMVRSMMPQLQTKLQEEGGAMDQVPVNMEYVLVEGARPPAAGPYLALLAASGLALIMFVVTWTRKYIVFQRTGGSVMSTAVPVSAPQGEAPPTPLRATGRFILDEKNNARFLNVPAVIVRLDTGELAIVSNVDASSYFMGAKTMDRKGLWAIVLTPGSLRDPELGRLYIGLQALPALRIRHAGLKQGSTDTTIMSFLNETDRATAIAEFNRVAGYEMIRA